MPKAEEEEKEIENLFEKIMKENLPNLAKEVDIQVQETQRVPNKLDPKSTTPRLIIIKLPKVKDEKRIFIFFVFIYLLIYICLLYTSDAADDWLVV